MAARRNDNGGGSIRQRRDGMYEGRISIPDMRRPSIYGKTQREVREKVTKMQADAQRGLPIITKCQTVAQYLMDWLENGTTVGVTTKPGYASYINKHIIPALGKVQLDKLTPQQAQAFIKAKQATNPSPRTVQYIYAVLRKALNDALKLGLGDRNVATLIPNTPKVRPSEVEPLTPDEVRALLIAIRGDRLEPLWITAMATSLRQGELLGLTWDNVDLDGGTVTVRRQLQ
jgi:integrase